MALADVYDALRSRRHYKNPIRHEECDRIIEKEKGEHFDPLVVEAFLSKEREFHAISEQMADQ